MTHQFKPGPAELKNGVKAKIYEVAEDGRIYGAYYAEGLGRWVGNDWQPGGLFLAGSCHPYDLAPPRPSGFVNLYRREDGSPTCPGAIATTRSQAELWTEGHPLVRTHCIDLSDPVLDKFRVDRGE